MKLKKKVERLLQDIKIAKTRPNSFGLLPDIVVILENMLLHLEDDRQDFKVLRKYVPILGRTITDNFTFAESKLGRELLSLGDEIRKISDSSD